MTVEEVADMLWEEYNSIGVTSVEAMCNLWDDIRECRLFPWIKDEHGVGAQTLALAVANVTLRAVEVDTLCG
jgi:hypothetical protein